jgi:ankyrin repeat protein
MMKMTCSWPASFMVLIASAFSIMPALSDPEAMETDHAMKLLNAALEKDVAAVRRLIKRGADVNARTQSESLRNMTPLHMAVAYGFTDIVVLLVEKKAAINAIDIEEMTPLDYARENKNKESISILKKHGGKTGKH